MHLFKKIVLALGLLLVVQVMAAQEEYILHTVVKGQGLYSIARIYGVTEADIIALNPGSETVIRVGEQLRIPHKTEAGTVTAVPPTTQTATADVVADGVIRHTVQPGETIYRLTVIYGVTGEQLYEANPVLRTETLKAGQVVIIPKAAASQTAASTTAAAENYRVKGAYGDNVSEMDADDKPDNFFTRLFRRKPKTEPATVEPDANCRAQHIVQRKETIYSISRIYGVTQEELLAANPDIVDGVIRRGQTLCIPYTVDNPLTPVDIDISDNQPVDTVFISAVNDGAVVHRPWTGMHVALILPFMLDDGTSTPSSDKSKMIEYYEGFLLAIDSLRSQGVSTDLHVYDSGGANTSIASILQSEEMASMDIIFGPMHSRHVDEAAAFAKEHNIPLVVPFSRTIDGIDANPNVWQVNATQTVVEDEALNHFFDMFPHPNVLFFKARDEVEPFCTRLQKELDKRQMEYHVLPADTTSDVSRLMEFCSREENFDNILMMTSSDNASLSSMIPVFQLMRRDTAAVADIHLYGYPQYQTYAGQHLSEFYELDTWYHSTFYTSNTFFADVAFHQLFHRTYSREIGNRYPRYAMLGFDTAWWFLRALSACGSTPPADVFSGLTGYRCNTLQTGFLFQPAEPGGGYINHKVYVVHMGTDSKIYKVDFEEW